MHEQNRVELRHRDTIKPFQKAETSLAIMADALASIADLCRQYIALPADADFDWSIEEMDTPTTEEKDTPWFTGRVSRIRLTHAFHKLLDSQDRYWGGYGKRPGRDEIKNLLTEAMEMCND